MMSLSSRDLWPEDIGVTSIVTPATILREQAALLAEKTKGLVQAEVKSSGSGESLAHDFILRVPALGNYRYVLFSAHHPMQQYPVTIDFHARASQELRAPDEGAFVHTLKEILASDDTRNVIQSLMGQIQD